jgi:Transposase DDE domain
MPKSRKTNRDHAKRQQSPRMEDEVIAAQLEQLLTPAVLNQSSYYSQLGIRDRILNLPLMVAAVMTLIWRNVPGVRELTKILAREGFLWCEPTQVRMGSGTKKTPHITMRLVEIRVGKVWHSYLTSVLDPTILPPYVVADLSARRWRIEEAFNTVKRLLGLSYLWTGAINQDLGVVKTVRKPNRKLIIAPFPERTSRNDGFFFDSSAQPRLTTAIAS